MSGGRLSASAAGALAAVALLPTPAQAQGMALATSLDLPFGRLLAGLLICTLVAFLAALLLKRFLRGGFPSLGALKPATWLRDNRRGVLILESRRLSPHADICRIASAGREYLVVVSGGGTTILRETAIPDDAEAPH